MVPDLDKKNDPLTSPKKKFICFSLNYTSPEKTYKTEHSEQSGCSATPNTQHLNIETKILPVQSNLNMLGTSFFAIILNPSHLNHSIINHQVEIKSLTPQHPLLTDSSSIHSKQNMDKTQTRWYDPTSEKQHPSKLRS